jgi:hypothetical protein
MSADQQPATGKGFIYILSNESMPGLLKVGLTENSVRQRIRELSSDTGVPTEFKLEKAFEIEARMLRRVEQSIHSRLKDAGFHHKKEFFSVSLSECTAFAEDAIFRVTGVRSPDIVGLAEKRYKEKEARRKWEAEELARRESSLQEANREIAQRRDEWLATREKPSAPIASWVYPLMFGLVVVGVIFAGASHLLLELGVVGLLVAWVYQNGRNEVAKEERSLQEEAAKRYPFKSLKDIVMREYKEQKSQETHAQPTNKEANRIDTQKETVPLPSDQERERQIQERINQYRIEKAVSTSTSTTGTRKVSKSRRHQRS